MFRCYTLDKIQTDHGNYVNVSKEAQLIDLFGSFNPTIFK